MKRLLFILFCTTYLFSCGDSETYYAEGINRVAGVWSSYEEDTDSLLLTRVFTGDYYSYFSFAEGCEQNELNKQRYSITDSLLVLEKYTQYYKIDGDTLWITNSRRDQTTKYVKNKNLSYSDREE